MYVPMVFPLYSIVSGLFQECKHSSLVHLPQFLDQEQKAGINDIWIILIIYDHTTEIINIYIFFWQTAHGNDLSLRQHACKFGSLPVHLASNIIGTNSCAHGGASHLLATLHKICWKARRLHHLFG